MTAQRVVITKFIYWMAEHWLIGIRQIQPSSLPFDQSG